MADYGSVAEVQKLAFGATDSNQDARCTSMLAIATSFINMKLNRDTDITSPSNFVTDAANLLAAGLIMTGQMQFQNAVLEHPFFKLALELIEKTRGTDPDDQDWGTIYPVSAD